MLYHFSNEKQLLIAKIKVKCNLSVLNLKPMTLINGYVNECSPFVQYKLFGLSGYLSWFSAQVSAVRFIVNTKAYFPSSSEDIAGHNFNNAS